MLYKREWRIVEILNGLNVKLATETECLFCLYAGKVLRVWCWRGLIHCERQELLLVFSLMAGVPFTSLVLTPFFNQLLFHSKGDE